MLKSADWDDAFFLSRRPSDEVFDVVRKARELSLDVYQCPRCGRLHVYDHDDGIPAATFKLEEGPPLVTPDEDYDQA